MNSRDPAVTGQSIIFADGAALGNPGPAGWGAVLLGADDQVTEIGGACPHSTNNRMELTAVIEALSVIAATPGAILIYSDSAYVVRGMREWLAAWKRRDWMTSQKTPVANRDLWERLDAAAGRHGAGTLCWHQIPGHSGIAGNERADAIATACAAGRDPRLYRGPRTEYGTELLPLPVAGPHSGRKQRRTAKAYSYVSIVGGQPMRHATWAECERHVKGRSGARFRKALSADDERGILRSWGVSPAELA